MDLVVIANRSLQKLGVAGISSLEEKREVAKDCKTALPFVCGSLLRQYSWGFAENVYYMPPLKSEDNLEYKFRLPHDFVSFLNKDPNWVIRGQYIIQSSLHPIKLEYIRFVDNPAEWDYLFMECVVLKLAVELCDRLVQSDSKKSMLLQELQLMLEEAKQGSGRETMSYQWC